MPGSTALVTTPPGVRLEWRVTGAGDPATVFAHGLAGDIDSTRPLGSAVRGRRVFFHFRGHGRSDAPPGPWSYGDLADDLRAVADLAGATRAVGVSLGAGALCRLLAADPTRFQRVVFFLPAVFDAPRPAAAGQRLTRLLTAVATGDDVTLTDLLAGEVPVEMRTTAAAQAYLRQRVAQLRRAGLAPALASLPAAVAVPDPGALAGVTARALVIASAGDDQHPVPVAERLAAALPHAALHVYDTPALLWTRRADLRGRISGFLNG